MLLQYFSHLAQKLWNNQGNSTHFSTCHLDISQWICARQA